MMHRIALPLLTLGLAVLAGCGAGEGNGQAGETQTSSAAASAEVDRAAVQSKLAAADAVDGATDHVVSLCSGCRLGMPGKAEHAISVAGYELHMCSASCKAHFEQDLEGAIAALEIPES